MDFKLRFWRGEVENPPLKKSSSDSRYSVLDPVEDPSGTGVYVVFFSTVNIFACMQKIRWTSEDNKVQLKVEGCGRPRHSSSGR